MAAIVYQVYDSRAYRDKMYAWAEVGSEMGLLLITVLAQESLRSPIRSKRLDWVGNWIFIVLGLILLLNVVYIIYAYILNCLDKRRKKELEK